MNNNILVVDIYSEKGVHERVNNAFFEHIIENNKVDNAFLVSNAGPRLSTDKIKFLRIPNFFFPNSRVGKLLVRDLILPVIILTCVIIITRRKLVIIGFSRLHILTFLPITLIFRNVSVLFHSQLEVYDERPRNRIRRGFLYLARQDLNNVLRSSNVKKLFLSRHLKDTLLCFGIVHTNCSFIDHPIEKKDLETFRSLEKEGSGSIETLLGNIGLFRDDTKKSSKIYDIARANQNLNFKLVGRCGAGFSFNYTLDNVQNIEFQKPVPYSRLVQESEDISHFIYYFDEGKYKFTASGTLVDAMCLNKIIVCNENRNIASQLIDVSAIKYNEAENKINIDKGANRSNYEEVLKRRLLISEGRYYDTVSKWLG